VTAMLQRRRLMGENERGSGPADLERSTPHCDVTRSATPDFRMRDG
jgi:hypothetical protein